MSDRESLFENKPNAFEGESSDGLFDSKSEAVVSLGAEDGEDTDVEILGKGPASVPTHDIGKGLMVRQPEPLVAVYRDGSHFGITQHGESSAGRQSEASTSGRGEAATEPSPRPRVSVVYPSNPRVPIGVPKEHLFGVDYLGPNKITEWEIAKYCTKYCIPDSVRMRILGPTESLSKPKDGEVVFFTDVLLQGVRLPLQPTVQKIHVQIRYAPGQYNPNFWVALMGVVTAFSIAEEREPSYEQFSYLYSVTKSKSADPGGWVQTNCLRASERGHFVSAVPTSQKSWKNQQVDLPFGKLKQPSPTQSEIRQIDRVRLKVTAVERVYPQFLFTANLVIAELANPAESKWTSDRREKGSKRRLMMGLQGKKAKRYAEAVPILSAGVDPEDQTIVDRLRQLNIETASIGASEVGGGRLPTPHPPRQPGEVPRVTLAAEDDENPAELITIACPSKVVQFCEPYDHWFANRAVQDRGVAEEAHTGGSMAHLPFPGLGKLRWTCGLCMRWAINAVERAMKAYEDGRAKVAEAGKALQNDTHLVKDMQAAKR
ncbi:unnamed protein product [Prunus armeniaca]